MVAAITHTVCPIWDCFDIAGGRGKQLQSTGNDGQCLGKTINQKLEVLLNHSAPELRIKLTGSYQYLSFLGMNASALH